MCCPNIQTNDFELLVTDKADLGNLPASLVVLAADEAKRRGHDCDCWVFTLQRPSINPFLEYSPNREMRKALFTMLGYFFSQEDALRTNAQSWRELSSPISLLAPGARISKTPRRVPAARGMG